jgi:glutathione S-transferase
MPDFAPDNPHGLILYDHPSSPCARRVRITLLEKGLAWDTQIIDLSRLEQRRPEYLRLNPNGFVPTLAHGLRVIYESNVITEYLDDAFPDVPLYPRDPWELAQVKMWQASEAAMAKDFRPLMYQRLMGPMVRLTRTLDEALTAARRSTTDPADLAWEERVWNLAVLTPDEEAQVADRLWKWLATLEHQLDGRTFLIGERFTQAEISVFPRVMMYPFVQLHIGAERFPNVTRWMAALSRRPSFAATVSAQDAQIARLANTSLLPWLARTLRKPKPSLVERLRLAIVRRAARRRMGTGRATVEQARGTRPLRQPRMGVIAPADRPVRRGPAPSAQLLAQPITLYDYVHSPHARRIRILLREKSLAWQTVAVDLHRLAHKAPAYLTINPNGEVPALRHGERVIFDSQLIAEYLDRIYPGNPLYPDDAFQLAQVRMWLALEAGTHKEFRPLFYLHVIRPELQAAGVTEAGLDALVPAGVHPSQVQWLRDTLRGTPRFDTSADLARDIIRTKLGVIEAKLVRRTYLVGDACTMADLAWFTRVDVLPRLGVPLPPARYPNLTRWFAMVAARPSIAEPRLEGSAGPQPGSCSEPGATRTSPR